VKHWCFQERKGVFPRAQGIAALDDPELPPGGIEMAVKTFLPSLRDVDRCIGGILHDRRDAARVIRLDVVDDDVFYPIGIDDAPDVIHR
jgi:hypothetical protein